MDPLIGRTPPSIKGPGRADLNWDGLMDCARKATVKTPQHAMMTPLRIPYVAPT